ncbi:MAG: glycine zipper 2TM domain-containing protein [Burkholderiaceae bacterium]|nr:glycine zipper 2TM domain-containing protein [Burkholderiaceae bacterium]
MLKTIHTRLVAAATLVLLLTACATPMPPPPVEVRRGVIEQITPTQIATNQHAGVGAILGGLAGVGIGSLIGGGTGRDVAMVAGAIGGAVVGNEVQKRNDQPIPAQQIMVRTSSGVLVAITQPTNPALRVGQRVYIQGNGESAVVTPQ